VRPNARKKEERRNQQCPAEGIGCDTSSADSIDVLTSRGVSNNPASYIILNDNEGHAIDRTRLRQCAGKCSCDRLLPLSAFSTKGRLNGTQLYERQCKACRSTQARKKYGSTKRRQKKASMRKTKVLDLNAFSFVEINFPLDDRTGDEIFNQYIERVLCLRNQSRE